MQDFAEELAVSTRTLVRWRNRSIPTVLRTPTGRLRVEEGEVERLRQSMRQ